MNSASSIAATIYHLSNIARMMGKGKHIRAGFTTNRGKGQTKARRQMVKKSRRLNRGK